MKVFINKEKDYARQLIGWASRNTTGGMNDYMAQQEQDWQLSFHGPEDWVQHATRI